MYEDSEIVVIDKPAGLVVHPGAGNPDTTLANAILHHYPENRMLARAGVVHRLDKGTTGLLVVARTENARQRLIENLEARTVHRQYLALVHGRPVAGGTVDEPIGRHPKDRRRMAVSNKGKSAVTHFRIERRLQFSHLVTSSFRDGQNTSNSRASGFCRTAIGRRPTIWWVVHERHHGPARSLPRCCVRLIGRHYTRQNCP